MKLRWTSLALGDLREIHGYIAERNPVAALKVARLLCAHAESLASYPEKGRLGRVEGTREQAIPGMPYVIAYRMTEATVDILAIRHGARDWVVSVPDLKD